MLKGGKDVDRMVVGFWSREGSKVEAGAGGARRAFLDDESCNHLSIQEASPNRRMQWKYKAHICREGCPS